METLIKHLPALNEYKIILLPHETLSNRIMEIKRGLHEKYVPGRAAKSVPQVILANFKQLESAEERIINRLRLIGMAAHPIKIELKDYGNYSPHTIYLQIINEEPLSDLVKKIRHDAQRLMKVDGEKPHFMSDPHLTLARRLNSLQFEKAWHEYAYKHFTGHFIAKNMLLVRRRMGEFNYHTIESFEFMNLPVEVKQGELF